MGQILQFRLPPPPAPGGELAEIDLMTAVDVALRDLADIMPHIGLDSAREQARSCRQMLQDAFDAALLAG